MDGRRCDAWGEAESGESGVVEGGEGTESILTNEERVASTTVLFLERRRTVSSHRLGEGRRHKDRESSE